MISEVNVEFKIMKSRIANPLWISHVCKQNLWHAKTKNYGLVALMLMVLHVNGYAVKKNPCVNMPGNHVVVLDMSGIYS